MKNWKLEPHLGLQKNLSARARGRGRAQAPGLFQTKEQLPAPRRGGSFFLSRERFSKREGERENAHAFSLSCAFFLSFFLSPGREQKGESERARGAQKKRAALDRAQRALALGADGHMHRCFSF